MGLATAIPTKRNSQSPKKLQDAVRLAGSQDYATKRGRVEICSVEIKSGPGERLAWLGDQLELWPLSFGRLLAWRILARLDEVGPRLQRLAASRDHLAVPV